jgi:hypothetical protein
VNTGSPSAFNPRIASPSAASAVSAPRCPRRRAREAEGADREALRQRLQQAAIGGAELTPDIGGARLAVDVRNLHAARIVEQDPEEVLLRHRGAHDQQRPEQAHQQDREDRQANRRQRDALPGPADASSIGVDRQARRHRDRRRGQVRAGGRREPELSLTEDDRRELEEKSKQGVEHECLE